MLKVFCVNCPKVLTFATKEEAFAHQEHHRLHDTSFDTKANMRVFADEADKAPGTFDMIIFVDPRMFVANNPPDAPVNVLMSNVDPDRN
jgi:hypothetical protein